MSSQKGTNQGQRERERKRQRRRLCQTCFSQAGPRSHLLSSFKGVVMVTVAGSQGWESVAWFPSGLQCGSWDDGKASQLWVDLSEQARPEFTQPKIEPAHLRFRPCLFRCLSLRRACHYNVGLTCFPGWVLAKVTGMLGLTGTLLKQKSLLLLLLLMRQGASQSTGSQGVP